MWECHGKGLAGGRVQRTGASTAMMLMIKVWVVKGISDALSVEPTARQYPWNNKKSPKQVKIVLGVFFC